MIGVGGTRRGRDELAVGAGLGFCGLAARDESKDRFVLLRRREGGDNPLDMLPFGLWPGRVGTVAGGGYFNNSLMSQVCLQSSSKDTHHRRG